jgi:2-oxoglutarate ferredoxin oxidoreductase subunit alpha
VIAAASPADCFDTALEAVRMATTYMTPVILLSDGYIANGSEPWRIPQVEELPDLRVDFHQNAEGFLPYIRDEKTLARPWAIPGTPGLEHRIGGLEKEDVTGNVNYEPDNHDHMVRLRAEKVARIAGDIPDIEVDGPESGKLLILGWGSTLGAITGAVNQARADGLTVSRAHLRHINPFPRNLGDILDRFERVLVPEMNLGQLALLLRARYLKDIETFSKVEGKPFTRDEILHRIYSLSGAETSTTAGESAAPGQHMAEA